MVTFSFVGYSAGSLVLGAISFIFTDADSLSLACIFVMMLGSFLNFVVLKEPPRFLFKKGRISEGFHSLNHISGSNKTRISQEELLHLMEYPRVLENGGHSPFESKVNLKITEKEQSFYDSIKPLLNRDSLYSIFALVCVSSVLYIVFYVSSVSISNSLGLPKIQYNEILLGVAHLIGNSSMIPYLQKVRRVKT